RAAVRGLVQRDGRGGGDVLAAQRRADVLRLEGSAGAATAAHAEHLAQDILKALSARTARTTAAPARAADALRSPGEALEIAFAAAAERSSARASAKAFKALEARLAFGIDLAAIELLALVRVADDLISAVQLGKFRGRLRVFLVRIRVQLLRKLAISLLDVFLAGAFRHPQHLIGVA